MNAANAGWPTVKPLVGWTLWRMAIRVSSLTAISTQLLPPPPQNDERFQFSTVNVLVLSEFLCDRPDERLGGVWRERRLFHQVQ